MSSLIENLKAVLLGEKGRVAQGIAVLVIAGIVTLIVWGIYALVKKYSSSPAPAPAQAPAPAEPPIPGVKLETKKLPPVSSNVSGYTSKTEYADCTFSTDFNTSLGVTISLSTLGTFGLYPSMEEVSVEWTHNGTLIASDNVLNPFNSESPPTLQLPMLVPTDTSTDIVCDGSSTITIKYRYIGGDDSVVWTTLVNQPQWSDSIKTQFKDLPPGTVNVIDISPGEEIGLEASGSSNLKYDIISKPGYSISDVSVTLINNDASSGKPSVTFKLDMSGKAGVSSDIQSDAEFEAVNISGQDMGEFVCLKEITSGKYLEIKFDSISSALGDFKLVYLDKMAPTVYSFVKMIPMPSVNASDFFYYYIARDKNGTDIGFLNTIGDESDDDIVELADLTGKPPITVFHTGRAAFDSASRSQIQNFHQYNPGYGGLGSKPAGGSDLSNDHGHLYYYKAETPGNDLMSNESNIPIASTNLNEVNMELNKMAKNKDEVFIAKYHGRTRIHKNDQSNATSSNLGELTTANMKLHRHLVYRILKDKIDLIHARRPILKVTDQQIWASSPWSGGAVA